jgi:hypothetical protein
MADEAFLRQAEGLLSRAEGLSRDIVEERRLMEQAVGNCREELDVTKHIALRLREHGETLCNAEDQGRALQQRAADLAEITSAATQTPREIELPVAIEPSWPTAQQSAPEVGEDTLEECPDLAVEAVARESPFAAILAAMDAEMSTLADALDAGLRETEDAIAKTKEALESAPHERRPVAPVRTRETGADR